MLLIFSLYDAEDKYNIEFIENYAKINLIPEVQRGVGNASCGQDVDTLPAYRVPQQEMKYKLRFFTCSLNN